MSVRPNPDNEPDHSPDSRENHTSVSYDSKRNHKSSRRRRLIIGGVSLVVALALVTGVFVTLISANRDHLADFESAREDLAAAQTSATELLDEAGSLEPDITADLQGQLDRIEEVLAEDPPGLLSFSIEDRTESHVDSMEGLDDPSAMLEEAIDHRSQYETNASEAEESLSSAEATLESTVDQVVDEEVHDQLSEDIDALNAALNTEPDEASGESFATLASDIAEASDAATERQDEVSDSHDAWVTAEEERKEEERRAQEEAEQTDPANYETLSERDWALVERDPDSHQGEKYVLYGHVTQADAATGDISIRVNSGPVQQYRQYDYDVNTMAITGRDGVFSDVVKGDHVEMLVEVDGSLTYDTMIGGSATAVLVAAYDVEVIGQF